MNTLLTELLRLSHEEIPAVLATIASINGSSPEEPGTQLLVTAKDSYGQWRNSDRQSRVIDDARNLLNGGAQWNTSTYHLNPIINTKNGELSVLFQRFCPACYPEWLKLARDRSEAGRVVLHSQFKDPVDPPTSHLCFQGMPATTWEALPERSQRVVTSMLKNKTRNSFHYSGSDETITVIQLLATRDPSVCVIGDSEVAKALTTQLLQLPLDVIRLTDNPTDGTAKNTSATELPLNAQSFNQIAEGSVVSIATGDHGLDLRFCEYAMQHPSLAFVGCLGSQKKAELLRSELRNRGYTDAQIKNLVVPIGLPTIAGKHPAIIAASIIAQILSGNSNLVQLP